MKNHWLKKRQNMVNRKRMLLFVRKRIVERYQKAVSEGTDPRDEIISWLELIVEKDWSQKASGISDFLVDLPKIVISFTKGCFCDDPQILVLETNPPPLPWSAHEG